MSETKALERLIASEDLSREEVEALFGRLMDGELDESTKAALLVALRMKGETPAEIAGAAAAMRSRVVRIPHEQDRAVDTCGTGGDGRGTFNISTAAAFVAAAAGAAVAKHGNRSVSSRSGSADVLAACGVPIEVEPEDAGRALDQVGIAFLFAPRLHPAMREVMPVRKALGIRTVFNALGPSDQPGRGAPAGDGRLCRGPGGQDRPRPRRARKRATRWWCTARTVSTRITTTGRTKVAEVRAGEVRSWWLDPRELRVPDRRTRVSGRRRAGGERGTAAGRCSPGSRGRWPTSWPSTRRRPFTSPAKPNRWPWGSRRRGRRSPPARPAQSSRSSPHFTEGARNDRNRSRS